MLDAAGYGDSDGDGVRDDEGRPIRLRLASRTENATTLTAARLIAGWLRELGLQIQIQNLESSALADRIFNTSDGKPDPDYDMFLWGWYNPIDPGGALAYFTSQQIGGLNDSGFSDAEYDRLYALQGRTLDPAKRKQSHRPHARDHLRQVSLRRVELLRRQSGMEHGLLDRVAASAGRPR